MEDEKRQEERKVTQLRIHGNAETYDRTNKRKPLSSKRLLTQRLVPVLPNSIC